MSLTGPALLSVVLVLTAVAFVGCVGLLPRFPGRAARPVLARAGCLLLVNALVLLSALVAFNDRFGFFADTTDLGNALFGTHQAVVRYHAGAGAPGVVSLPIAGRAVLRAVRSPGASLPSYVVQGDGVRGQVLVSLPRDYWSPAAAGRRYPVLVALHGYPGPPAQMITEMGLRTKLDRAAQRHSVADAIVLAPEWEVPGGIDTECVDGGSHGPAVESWLTDAVPRWAMRVFRVLPAPRSWATTGLSAGGWCAAMLAMRHPDVFSAAVVLGGYFEPKLEHSYDPFAHDRLAAARYDLVPLARRTPPPVSLFVETSRADQVSYPSTIRLLGAARSPMRIDAVVLAHAGHRLGVWAAELVPALTWLGRLPGFAPG